MKHRIFGAWFALALILGGCDRPAAPAPQSAPPATPVPASPTPDPNALRFGFLVPLTGDQASFGVEARNGAELAVDELNASGGLLGQSVRLLVRDTASQTDTAAAEARALLENEDVHVLIGEIASDRTLAIAPLAQERGIPLITPAATHPDVTRDRDFVFRVCYTDDIQAVVLSRFARSIQANKAAILSDSETRYSAGLAEIFRQDFTTTGGRIVAEQTFRAGDATFAAPLAAIKAATPDVVFLPAYFPDAARIIREAREAGIDVPFLGTDGWDSPEFLKTGGPAVENCYLSGHFAADRKSPAVAAFAEKYTARFGAPPPPLAALAYDAVQLAADAIRRANAADPVPLRDALAATAEFSGVTGTIRFDANRNPSKSAVILRIENGAFTYLETEDPQGGR